MFVAGVGWQPAQAEGGGCIPQLRSAVFCAGRTIGCARFSAPRKATLRQGLRAELYAFLSDPDPNAVEHAINGIFTSPDDSPPHPLAEAHPAEALRI